jgi:hypothetical protein
MLHQSQENEPTLPRMGHNNNINSDCVVSILKDFGQLQKKQIAMP